MPSTSNPTSSPSPSTPFSPSPSAPPPPIPITIITGFLGAGKTTLLLNLLPQLHSLNPSYSLALLKNEFGDVAVDSKLANQGNISGVQELLNGCICCNLVGSLAGALMELEGISKDGQDNGEGKGTRRKRRIDRIILETSGSAFPATLAMEINRISRETGGKYELDGVISVIDVENWKGYDDTSFTARLQARYTDLVVFNKWEGVGERRWEECLDRLGDLEVQVPWVKSRRGWVSVGVVFGLDGGLRRGLVDGYGDVDGGHGHEHKQGDGHDHQSEVEVLSITLTSSSSSSSSSSPSPPPTISIPSLTKLLTSAPKDEIYRIKAIFTSSGPLPGSDTSIIRIEHQVGKEKAEGKYILNWAFGRWTCTRIEDDEDNGEEKGEEILDVVCRMTMLFVRDESTKWKKRIEGGGFVEVDGEGKGELKVVRVV